MGIAIGKRLVQGLGDLWRVTSFESPEMERYAERFITPETRRGVTALGVVLLTLLAGASALYFSLDIDSAYGYTFLLLCVLSLHVTLSARTLNETRVLHLLSITLLVVCGCAFVLLAHRTGGFGGALLSSVVLLFMVVPMVPWGLREATMVVLLVYFVFTLSSLSVEQRFDLKVLLILQFVMLGSAIASLTLVARSVSVRKHDIKARWELEGAHRRLEQISYEDGLTGAWNRRYLDVQFTRLLRRQLEGAKPVYFGVMDIDDFKQINDGHGHAVGDATLCHLAKCFRRELGDSSYLFRMGGDEFAILYAGEDPQSCVQEALRKTQHAMLSEYGQLSVPVRVSVGMVEVSPDCSQQQDRLYHEADVCLYMAKRQKDKSKTVANFVCRRCDNQQLTNGVHG